MVGPERNLRNLPQSAETSQTQPVEILEAGAKDVGKGTGLGLDISRRIIDRHDGVIEFDSRPGSTTAGVRIPITRKP